MNILINNQQQDLPIDTSAVVAIVNAFVRLENIAAHEVSINFVDTLMISQLHADYFDDPSTTDCISFPFDDEDDSYCVLGEIFVCPKTAIEYCLQHGGSPEEETVLYTIHGLLHLIGLDDIEEDDREEMRTREKLHLDNLRKLNLLAK